MNRTVRTVVFACGAGVLLVLLVVTFVHLPHFGGGFHPYRDHAVDAAVRHATANVVSSVNFDQRVLDTLGEESILFASVVGAAVLLRPNDQEHEVEAPQADRQLRAVPLLGTVLIPLTLAIALDLVLHGTSTPGGGFQGGVALATGVHLMYVAGSYQALERTRHEAVYRWAESLGAAAFAVLGVVGIAMSGSLLANVVPKGQFGTVDSGGTVPLFNLAVGAEVAAGVVILLAAFLDQVLKIRRKPS